MPLSTRTVIQQRRAEDKVEAAFTHHNTGAIRASFVANQCSVFRGCIQRASFDCKKMEKLTQ